jgi:hypothetical protein
MFLKREGKLIAKSAGELEQIRTLPEKTSLSGTKVNDGRVQGAALRNAPVGDRYS